MSATVLPSYAPTSTISGKETSSSASIPSLVPVLTNPSSPNPCTIHNPTPTPHIDAHLHTPQNRAYLLSLSESLADLADSDDPHCTKCTIDSITETMTMLLRDVKATKKSGAWTKEEKKAMKKEAKMLGKGVKAEGERVWREGEGEKEKRKGWW